MEANVIKVEGFEILEIKRGRVFEYYVKPYDENDFIFAFGVLDKFTEVQLKVLAARGYFDNFEQG